MNDRPDGGINIHARSAIHDEDAHSQTISAECIILSRLD